MIKAKMQDVTCLLCKQKWSVEITYTKPYNKTTKPFICHYCRDKCKPQ